MRTWKYKDTVNHSIAHVLFVLPTNLCTMCMPWVCGGQKVLDYLKLKLEMVVSPYVGAEN